jgi:hypothetical protein
MGHIRTPQADFDLDDIWYQVSFRQACMKSTADNC